MKDQIERFSEGGEANSRILDLRTEQKELEERIEAAEESKAAAKKRLSEFRESQPNTSKLAELHALGASIGLREKSCPLCGEPHTEESYEERLRRLKSVVSEIVDEIDALKTQVDEQTEALKELKNEKQSTNDELEGLENERKKLKRNLLACIRLVLDVTEGEENIVHTSVSKFLLRKGKSGQERSDIESSSEIGYFRLDVLNEERLRTVISQRREDRVALSDATSELEASLAYERVEPMQKELDEANEELEKLKQSVSHANEMAERANKVRLEVEKREGDVHKDRIDELTPLIAELYSRMRPHVDWESIDTKVRGETQLYFSFKVGDDSGSEGRKNPSLFFSSGQRRALGLAFLLSVHLGCTWSRLNTLILDDPIQHIDDFRALQLTEVLSSIRRTGRQVIVTVEDEALARLLCRRLRSSIDEPGAHVQMAYDARSGTRIKRALRVGPMPRRVLQPTG